MAFSFLFSPNFTPLSSTKPMKHLICYPQNLPSSPLQYINNKKCFPLPAVASIPYQPINVDYLEEEFSGHGVTFTDIGENYVVKMELDNGSMASLMLPSGLITSYKALMWHGGKLEVLHTSVSEGDNGDAVIQGGVSLDFKCGSEDGVSWSPSTWDLHGVRGSPQDSIQVELISRNNEGMAEVEYIVTLQQDMLSSELLVTNSLSSPLQLTGSVISHLTVSTPDATFAVGLEGSNFFISPPFSSNFGIIPPEVGQKKDVRSGRLWGQMELQRFLPGWGMRNQNNANDEGSGERENGEEMEGEENDNYKNLTEKMSRIYTSAPRYFTVIDRGRRNSIVVGRDGFDELYMFSPGAGHEYYSKYAFICVGQSAMLKPITLSPEDTWRGGQHLHNPNL